MFLVRNSLSNKRICSSLRNFSTLRGGRPATEAELHKITTPNMIFDRYESEVYNNNVRLFSRGWFAQIRFRMAGSLKSYYAVSRVRVSLRDFYPKTFAQSASDIFLEFMSGLSMGFLPEDVTTETLIKDMKNTGLPVNRLMGTPGLASVKQIENAEYVQCRLLPVTKELAFCQITYKFTTISKLQTHATYSARKYADLRKWLQAHGRRNPPGYWAVAFCNKGEYYYNSHTKVRKWERPVPVYGTSAPFFDAQRGTLGSFGRVLSDPDENGYFKAEYIVTFERPLFNLRIPWRITLF